jgi:hypothetical protein
MATQTTYHGLSAKVVAEIVPAGGLLNVDGVAHQCFTLQDSDFNVTADQPMSANATAFWVEKEVGAFLALLFEARRFAACPFFF